MRSRVPGLVLALAASTALLAACGGGDDAPAATTAPSQGATLATTQAPATTAASPSAATKTTQVAPSPEDMVAAFLKPDDVTSLPGMKTQFWQHFPDVAIAGYATSASSPARPGEVTWVYQAWDVVNATDGDPLLGRLIQSMTLYADESAAKAALAYYIDDEVKKYKAGKAASTAVGDESQYLTLKDDSARDVPYVAEIRFRVGRVTARVEWDRPAKYESPETMAAIAKPLAANLQALLAGNIKAAPLTSNLDSLLPPASAGLTQLRRMLDVSRNVDAWALIATGGKPRATSQRLTLAGAKDLGRRIYGLEADRSQIVLATVFPLITPTAAATWQREFAQELTTATKKLDAGKTGSASAFALTKSGIYELQFAKGKNVVSVICGAADAEGKPAASCEDAVRKLAESWYASLPE